MASRPFGPALVTALESRGWSKADLRRALSDRGIEVTHSAVGEWARGSTLPSADKAAVIIELLTDGDQPAKELLWESLSAHPTDEAAA